MILRNYGIKLRTIQLPISKPIDMYRLSNEYQHQVQMENSIKIKQFHFAILEDNANRYFNNQESASLMLKYHMLTKKISYHQLLQILPIIRKMREFSILK